MRITNSMLTSTYMKNLNRNLNRMDYYDKQLASSSRITKLSDDPVGVMAIIDARSKINKLEEYKSNVDDCNTWLTQAESAVSELNEIIKDVYEKTINASNGVNTIDEKNAIALFLDQSKAQILSLSNSSLGNFYIFGGYNILEPPFQDDGTNILYNGVDLVSGNPATINQLKSENIEFEIGKGIKMPVTINGIELIGTGDDNIFKMMDELITSLKSDSGIDVISTFVSKFEKKQGDALSILATIGGRANRLEMVEQRYAQDELNYQTIMSNKGDIDVAQTIMEFKTAESVYTAALAIGGKIIQPTLVDFLR